MSAIQVKNVPADLHEALRRRAAREGMNLQDYLLRLIRRDLALPSQAEWLDELRAQPSAVADLSDAAEVLRSARRDRLGEHGERD